MEEYRELIGQSDFNNPKSEKYRFAVNGLKFINSLNDLFTRMYQAKTKPIDPCNVFSRMIWPNGSPMFKRGKQADALEFVNYAFELIEAGFELDQVSVLILSNLRTNG